jgi:hypothetical protein
MRHILTIALSALALYAPALAQTTSIPAPKFYSEAPTGNGDPNTIACLAPQKIPGSWLRGPAVCATNAVWARYNKAAQTREFEPVIDTAPLQQMAPSTPTLDTCCR